MCLTGRHNNNKEAFSIQISFSLTEEASVIFLMDDSRFTAVHTNPMRAYVHPIDPSI